MGDNDRTTLVQVRSMAKAFGPTQALRDASFELRAGEVHALVGENGSGKSTLVKILSGVHAPDAGELELFGRAASAPATPKAAQQAGIVTVFQEILVADARSVVDNIWLGTDGLLRTVVSRREKRARAAELLEELLERPVSLDASLEELSLSDRQACCIVRALVRDPRILILDEATSALDVATRDRLFHIVTGLSANGVGVVFITHRMDEISEIGDRITVMRSGVTVADLYRDNWTPQELVRLMTGSDHLVEHPRRETGLAEASRGERAVTVRGLSLGLDKRSFSAEIHAGELVGVAGLEGHGQEEFLMALVGGPRTAGEVVRHVDGHEVAVVSPAQASKVGIAYVPRDRRQSLFGWMSIRENFAMPTLSRDARGGWLRPRLTRRRLEQSVAQLSIVLGDADHSITTLSGGNQQKVVIGRWLASGPRVLLLNDPTRGIDVGAKRDLYMLLTELADAGLAVVMVSSEVDEHVELMDRVLVFREGELFREIPRGELSRQSLVSAFFGETGAAAAVQGPRPEDAATPRAAAAAAPAHSRIRASTLAALRLLNRYSFGFALLLSLALLVTTLIRQPNFGWSDQLATFAPLAIAAMASTPAIISGGGGFDLSISPLMFLCGEVFIVWLVPHGLGGAEAVPIVIAVGLAVGALSGLLIILLRVPPVVATLSMYFVLIGVDLRVAPNPQYLSSNWVRDLATSVGPFPGALFTLGTPILVWVLLGQTAYRRTLYAVGSNDATAFSSGVNVALVRLLAYATGGAFAAVGGIALIALTSSANPSLSSTYTLLAIAAVALGGTSLWGGRGGLLGPLLGAAAIYLLGNLLTSMQVNPNYLKVMYGAMLVFAVVLGGLAGRAKGSA